MATLAELLAKKQNNPPNAEITKAEASIEVKEEAKEELKDIPPIPAIPLPEGISQETADIIHRIRTLSALSQEDIKSAMDSLKIALLQNPAAVAIMLPEDIGEMVKALRQITGQAIAESSKPKEKKSKKTLTPEELAAAFEEL